jgi:dienelactone hydrolase
VLLDCGTDDQTWISCTFAEAIQRRLTAAGDRYAHVLYRYAGAGHLVDSLIPYEPTSFDTPAVNGDSPLANADADARLWPDILRFLADPSGRTGTFTAPATPPLLRSAAARARR